MPPVLTPAPLRTPDRHLLLSGPQPPTLRPPAPLPWLHHLLGPRMALSSRQLPSAPARPAPGAPLTVLSGAWPWEEGARDQQQREGQGAGERRARHSPCRRPNSERAEAGAGAGEGRGGREGAGERARERAREAAAAQLRPSPSSSYRRSAQASRDLRSRPWAAEEQRRQGSREEAVSIDPPAPRTPRSRPCRG